MGESLAHSFGRLNLNAKQDRHRRGRKKKLFLLRGLPGSGKTTLARQLKHEFPSAVIFSTDDYFIDKDGRYFFERDRLGKAHEWNQTRARTAMKQGKSPIIIDNTNIQAWEMKPYVNMALKNDYEVTFREPDTYWKFNTRELERKNTHNVPREKIERMKEQYTCDISIDDVLDSEDPTSNSRLQGATFPRNTDYFNSEPPSTNTRYSDTRTNRGSHHTPTDRGAYSHTNRGSHHTRTNRDSHHTPTDRGAYSHTTRGSHHTHTNRGSHHTRASRGL
nr:PREDICTED: NEDD4-binding protein 2-like 1 isoform X2 [Latimeria chalumnae]|eukprot:XP_014349577.1 PREDICTED: NEDD4-binding protein 2-like 1 isoform X2 [Latimeria chalumnae]